MLFTEEEAPLLKKWIVTRLENTSDADADVLADYVLALLRHDGDTNSVRQLCDQEIVDFLKDDSTSFVQDVFDAIECKSYLPGAVQSRNASMSAYPPAQIEYSVTAPSVSSQGTMNGSRKRPFNDQFGAPNGRDGYAGRGDFGGRPNKMYRQSGYNNILPPGPPGYGDNMNGSGRGGRGGSRGGMVAPYQPPPQHDMPPGPNDFRNLPPMPSPLPGMPQFDPNNPMEAILSMQRALGLPMPGTPGYQQSADASRPARKRCRDFDVKGFCARGNTCMYDHGTNSSSGWTPPKQEEYDPAHSSIIDTNNCPSVPSFPHPLPTPSFSGSFSTSGDNNSAPRRGQSSSRGHGFPAQRGGRRSEISSDKPNHDRRNTTIVVENIPEPSFNETTVREFFSEFGTIVECTMMPYKRLATLKFADWSQAQAAYTSPKVIFDNRFVKVFWYCGPDSLPKVPANGGKREASAAAQSTSAPSEPEIDIEEFKQKQELVQKDYEARLKKKAEMEEQAKELKRRQEELLERQAEEKRKLMAKIAAKKSGSPASGDAGSGSESKGGMTEALKAQLAKLEEEALGLGIDPTQAVQDDGGEVPWYLRGRGRGRGVYRGRGAPRGGFRGGYRGGRGGGAAVVNYGAYNLDNRPKTVALAGVDFSEADREESLREYLLGIGDYTDLQISPARTTITFKDRATAEKFMFGLAGLGNELPSVGRVALSWVQTPLPPVSTGPKPVAVKTESLDVDMGNGEGTAGTAGAADGVVENGGNGGNGGGGNGHSGAYGGKEEMDHDVSEDYDVAGDEW